MLLFKVLLLGTNFSILSYLLWLIIQHYRSSYDKKSWASLFHLFSFSWLLVRGIFWISTLASLMKWSSATFFMLYWMPTPLEFGAFMLLPLFFAQILYPDEWKAYWGYARPIYFTVIFGTVLFSIVWSFFRPAPKDKHCYNVVDDYFAEECFHTEDSTVLFREITAVCFLFLAIIQCWFGVKVLKMDKTRYDQFFMTTPEMLSIVNILLVVSFSSRSFYQIMAINKILILPDIPLQSDGDIQPSIFIACELWIYMPTILIILHFTSRAMGRASVQNNPLFVASYGTHEDIEADYEFKEVPSRHPSFYVRSPANATELIPILQPTVAKSELYLSSSSVPRAQSWLSEPDSINRYQPRSYTEADRNGGSVDKEGTLLNYFRKNQNRQRGLSTGSDTSSIEGSSSRKFDGAGKKPYGLPKSSRSKRKLRGYDGKHPGAVLPTSSSEDNKALNRLEMNTYCASRSEDQIEEDNEEDGEDEEEYLISTPYGQPFVPPLSMGTIPEKQYEFMVEPPSPSPRNLMQDNDVRAGYPLSRSESYEATGGDHVHGSHFFPANTFSMHEQPNESDDHHHYSMQYHHHRASENKQLNGGSNNNSNQASTNGSFGVNPVYPRPTRHNPSAVTFTKRTVDSSPKITDRRPQPKREIIMNSVSPSTYEKGRRSEGNNSTPDREEMVREAARLRQGMNGSRYSPP